MKTLRADLLKGFIFRKKVSDFIDARGYDFLDFGCSAGGSLENYGKMFSVKYRGLGLDLDPKKVELTLKKGYEAKVCDLTKFQVDARVKFCVMHHFLEHVPSINDVERIIRKACLASTDFVIIRQPYFDADPYLFSLGLKFFWSDWTGHPNHMTLLEFHNILRPLVLEKIIKKFSFYGLYPLSSSEDSSIHGLDSGIDQHDWDAKKHPPKNIINFDKKIYKESLAILDVSGDSTDNLINFFRRADKLFDSVKGFDKSS